MDRARSFLKLWLPVIAYAVLIFSLSSIEQPFYVKFKVENIDKVLHFLEFLVFGLLLIRAIYGSDEKISRKTAILIVFAIGTFYGFTDELHQNVVPGRFSTVSDFIFDSLGSLIGAIMWRR